MKNRIENQGDGKSWEGLYQVPEITTTIREDLYTPPFHPYIDKFQELMDRSFEAGLHQAGEEYYYRRYNEKDGERKPQKRQEEKDILDFESIVPFFLILIIGFGFALLAFLFEIFSRDFLSELSRNYFRRKYNEIFRREVKIERRIIQVKPREI